MSLDRHHVGRLGLDDDWQDAWEQAVPGIVDDLAARGFAVRHGLFPDPFSRRLAAGARDAWADGAFHRAGIGRGGDHEVRSEIRTDHVLWIDPAQPTAVQARYLGAIHRLAEDIRHGLYLPVQDFEAHFALYPPGAFYTRHVDQFRDTGNRLISCLLYLNWDWRRSDGGALRLHLDGGGSLDVLPEAGTFVAFPSETLEHEVLPTQRERLSLTGWLRRRAIL